MRRSVYRMCRLVCFQFDSLLISKEEKHVSRTYLQGVGKTTAVLGNSVDSASFGRNNGLLIGSAYLYACGCFRISHFVRHEIALRKGRAALSSALFVLAP